MPTETSLAEGFLLTDGKVIVDLPVDTVARTGAIVVLMGDSGNASPTFRIVKAPAVSIPKAVQLVGRADDVAAAARRSAVWG
jgi:predicted NAD/FAD-dependent oxidoreductase